MDVSHVLLYNHFKMFTIIIIITNYYELTES